VGSAGRAIHRASGHRTEDRCRVGTAWERHSLQTKGVRMRTTPIRYLRDVYDSTNDYTGESISVTYPSIISALNSWPVGTGNRQVDEPWNSTRTVLDDRDGRSGVDFRDNLFNLQSINTLGLWANNCSPVGD
jgi:hypothetical protein